MTNKHYISGKQLLLVLLTSRLLFPTNYIPAINPGNSIQDILPSIPAVFVLNLLVGIPVLMLLKRHPGRDLADCSVQILGKAFGFLFAAVYLLFFLAESIVTLGIFHCFYSINILRETGTYAVLIPIILVCLYGAAKGIEPLARFGTLAFIFYILVVVIIDGSEIPQISLGYLKPMFYNGWTIFFQAVSSGLAAGFQILILGMCAPYLKPEVKVARIYVLWDLISSVLLFLTNFYIVTVLGPYGSKQIFPIQTLGTLASFSVFSRLDSFIMIAWILNAVLNISVYFFSAAQCLNHTPVRKHRIALFTLFSIITLAAAPRVSESYLSHLSLFISPAVLLGFLCLTVVLPLIVLIVDIVKGKVAKNEQAA